MAAVSRLEEFLRRAEQSGVPTVPVTQEQPSESRIEFLGRSDNLRGKLDNIERLVEEMMENVYRFQSVTTSSERKIAVATFEATVLDANTRLRDAKVTLDSLQQSNAEFQSQFGEERSSEWSFRVAALAGHTKRLRGLFTRIATAQTSFEAEMNRRIATQGLLTPEATAELPMTPIGSLPASVGAAKMLSTVGQEEQRLRVDDMRRVEKSLREIREAFLQIAALVDSQGEMLDCIEFSVVNAKNYSHQANLQLIKARKKQRLRSMLWCCCGILVTGAVIAIILVVLNATGVIKLGN